MNERQDVNSQFASRVALMSTCNSPCKDLISSSFDASRCCECRLSWPSSSSSAFTRYTDSQRYYVENIC